jgi:hypothetical protein
MRIQIVQIDHIDRFREVEEPILFQNTAELKGVRLSVEIDAIDI